MLSALFGVLCQPFVVVGYLEHDLPGSLVAHLVCVRAGFFCATAPVRRVVQVE